VVKKEVCISEYFSSLQKNLTKMKKNLIFTILLSLLTLTGISQLELKPAIGLTVASFDSKPVFEINDDTITTNGKVGYQFGASLAIGRKLYVEPGVFYTRLTQDMDPFNIEMSDFTYSASFVRIPVNFGFQFIGSSESLAGLKIFLGPSMLIPVGVKDNDYPLVKEDVVSPQFDISVGAGLNVWFIFLDVSYGWGLTPQYVDDPMEAKMKAFYANLGFRFKLGPEEEGY
jgi:hypothetical protein